MHLSNRLKALTALAPACGTAADIGSDHGLLPIALVLSGRAKKGIAADISRVSLQKAARHAAEYGLEDKIELRAGDGLSVLRKGEASLVAISGLGGVNIADILSRGKDRLQADTALLISANNSDRLVRGWLIGNGYRITAEDLVIENRRHYQIMLAVPGEGEDYSGLELEFGKRLIENRHPLLVRLVEKRTRDAEKMKKTAGKADNERSRAAYREAERRIGEYGRLKKWLSQ
jgi:tRNA (adenine22-N1)-methyltransferase